MNRSQTDSPSSSVLTFVGLRTSELGSKQAEPAWLWRGYLAERCVTLFTSQWKSGKTTLISILLDRMTAGGDLLGLPLQPAKVAVISEETSQIWDMRRQRLQFGEDVWWFCQPFHGRKPEFGEWLALVQHVLGLRAQGVNLVVIDSLTSVLPGHCENDAAGLMEALLPLQHLTAAGMSVLLVHHPRKGKATAGQAARGSGALTSFVDLMIEMYWFDHAGDVAERRRRLLAFSRFQATPPHLVIELNAEGVDYLVHGDYQEVAFADHW